MIPRITTNQKRSRLWKENYVLIMTNEVRDGHEEMMKYLAEYGFYWQHDSMEQRFLQMA